MQIAESKRTLAAWLAAFTLIVLGAKVWTIQLWTTNLPYWDQWDEARLLFIPWLEGHLTWHDLFIHHNEHRIFFTRLLDLLEVKINGQWDIYFQTVVNAFIHIAYGCGLVAILWHLAGRKNAGLICFALIPFFALPFSGENTTLGFQSQFYFANIFSVLAILGLGFGRPCGKVWFGGLLAALCALFTMASGFLAAAAIIGLILLRAVRQKSLSRPAICTILLAATVIAMGLALKVDIAQHAQLKAKSPGDFLRTLVDVLAWPFSECPIMVLLVCLPVVVVAIKYFRGKFENPRVPEFILALAGWSLLQAVVLAYGRARIVESSRYSDALSTLPLVNSAALFVLANLSGWSPRLKKFAPAMILAWCAVILAGEVQESRVVAKDYLDGVRGGGLAQLETVRAYLATKDPAVMQNADALAVPHWSYVPVMEALNHPALVAILPDDAFPPADASRHSGHFSAAALWLVDHAVAVLCVGLILSLLLAARALRQPGISLHNEGLGWVCILLIAVVVGIGAFSLRDINRVNYAIALHERVAVYYTKAGRDADAAVHLREVLRLKPDDAEARSELEVVQSHMTNNPTTLK
ncbi:MAG TPA: hypothetical protein VK742_20575 [Candidatus Sulfotelmatobacter sp.]|nr:hypothetical protein [Candidatus Sulfotelmatobacter sp.]